PVMHIWTIEEPIRVGVYDNKPLVFMGNSGPEGLFIDVLESVAREQGWKLDYRFASWDECFKAVQTGELDLLPVVAYNEDRARQIQFSDNALIANWGEIFTQRGLDINSIGDLQDRTIAYLGNDTHSLFFRKLLDTLGISHASLMVNGYADMLAALEDGRADAGVFNHLQANLAADGHAVRITPIVFNPIQIRYASPKGDPAGVLAHLDAHIQLMRSGDEAEYRRLLEHWFGVERRTTMPGWAWVMLMAGLSATLLVLGLNIWLQKMVRTRTADLEASNRTIQESESRYRSILSSAMDGFLLVDQTGKILEANEAYCRMSGFNVDELLPMHISQLDARDNHDMVANRVAMVAQKGHDRFESVHRRRDGSLYDVEISLQYHPDNPGHLVSFVRDISERKRFERERLQAERAIHEQAEYQRAIFDYSPLPMFSLDLEGRVIICNTAAERIFGWSRDEIAGRILPLVPDDKLEEFHRLKDQLIAGQTVSGVELARQRKDGSTIDVSLWSAPIYNDKKEIIGLISFYEDIGERKAIAERLERNLAEKQILLREVHHRVKNNLSVISSLLNLQSATITNPEQALEAFRNSRDRIMAMALVHMELYESGDFVRIDMGTYLGNLARQIALVNENAGQVSLSSHAENLMLDLQVAVPCGLILNELITNAYKYGRREGMKAGIDVSMTRTGDGQFAISVSDNGPGLPTGYEDTGSLGFTLVKLLVDQIDGIMDTDSSGNGTTIRIRFPDSALS
ncbi:MAG: PAS domain S-box protein, partial [Clostridia bacterium]